MQLILNCILKHAILERLPLPHLMQQRESKTDWKSLGGHAMQRAKSQSPRKTIKGFCMVTHSANLPRTVPILVMKTPHPRKSFSPRQTRTAGHPGLGRLFNPKNWRSKFQAIGHMLYGLKALDTVHLHEQKKSRCHTPPLEPTPLTWSPCRPDC